MNPTPSTASCPADEIAYKISSLPPDQPTITTVSLASNKYNPQASLASLVYTPYLVNDIVLAKVCFVLASIVLGFFLVNYPFGKIFLGDGGAYLLGFWLGWIAVVLIAPILGYQRGARF